MKHASGKTLAGARVPARRTMGRAGAWLALAVVSLAGTGCFRIGGEAGELRDVVLQSVGGDVRMDKQIEFSAGAVALALVRTASGFANDLPPEARLGMKAVRKAQVGVYPLRGDAALDRVRVVMASTAALLERGWQRTVCVMDGSDTVLVFVPEDLKPDGDLDVCVLVVDGADLVVASARLARKPLGRLMALAIEEGIRSERMPRADPDLELSGIDAHSSPVESRAG